MRGTSEMLAGYMDIHYNDFLCYVLVLSTVFCISVVFHNFF
jgi:hypothetical protein